MKLGLFEDWREVIDVLESISGSYDKVNRWISLGSDVRLRREAVRNKLNNSKRILDLGSGNGIFTKITLMEKQDLEIVMLDFLISMLKQAKEINKQNTNAIQAVFEHMPFRNGVFDKVIAAFSLRDAVDGEKALEEVARVLRREGSLIVCDIMKPNNKVLQALVGFYWLCIAPLLALFATGLRGLKVWIIWKTYRRWPTINTYIITMKRYFRDYELRKKMLIGAFIAEFRN